MDCKKCEKSILRALDGRITSHEKKELDEHLQKCPLCSATQEEYKVILNTLKERDSRYGSFNGHAGVSQGIKRAMKTTRNWQTLSDPMNESLEMTAHKIGRILNGDPLYKDSWHDIIGYTKLVEETLED